MSKNKILISLTTIVLVAVLIVLLISPKDNVKKTTKEEQPKDLFEDYYTKASELLQNMSIEEKIGQMFLVRYSNEAEKQIKNYYPSGFVLYAKDFENETKSTIKEKLNKNQSLSKTPLIFAVDEEGGTVVRVSKYKAFRKTPFLSPKDIYNEGGYDLLKEQEYEKLSLLLDLGINLNLAPVVDISTNKNDYIYERSFGKSAKETSEYVTNMVGYSNDLGISSALKHFPGYGNNKDTHTGIAIDERSYETFLNSDYLPFQSGIESKVPVILVSHNIVTSIDNKYPATLSKTMHDELRNKLKFTGIIMTDDLSMDAIKKYADNKEAATLAINAGNDIIITSDFINMYNEVKQNINNNKISIDTINMAVQRILSWKLAYNIIK